MSNDWVSPFEELIYEDSFQKFYFKNAIIWGIHQYALFKEEKEKIAEIQGYQTIGDHCLGFYFSNEFGIKAMESEAKWWVKELQSYKKYLVNLRWEAWERDNFTCQMCESRRFLSIDHIKPLSKGGDNSLNNLQTLCKSCNSKKGNRKWPKEEC